MTEPDLGEKETSLEEEHNKGEPQKGYKPWLPEAEKQGRNWARQRLFPATDEKS